MIFNVKEIVKKKKLVHHENYLIYNKWLTCPLIIPHLSLNLPHLSTDNTSPHPWFLSIRPLIMPRLPLPISHLTPDHTSLHPDYALPVLRSSPCRIADPPWTRGPSPYEWCGHPTVSRWRTSLRTPLLPWCNIS